MASLSLQRSKKLLEDQGFKVWIVETWNQWIMQRRDLYNMCDLVAIRHDRSGVMGIQCCGEDVGSHVTKLLEGYTDGKGKVWGKNEYLPVWLSAGNTFFIWAWRKRGARGERKTWKLREIEFLLDGTTVIHREVPKDE